MSSFQSNIAYWQQLSAHWTSFEIRNDPHILPIHQDERRNVHSRTPLETEHNPSTYVGRTPFYTQLNVQRESSSVTANSPNMNSNRSHARSYGTIGRLNNREHSSEGTEPRTPSASTHPATPSPHEDPQTPPPSSDQNDAPENHDRISSHSSAARGVGEDMAYRTSRRLEEQRASSRARPTSDTPLLMGDSSRTDYIAENVARALTVRNLESAQFVHAADMPESRRHLFHWLMHHDTDAGSESYVSSQSLSSSSISYESWSWLPGYNRPRSGDRYLEAGYRDGWHSDDFDDQWYTCCVACFLSSLLCRWDTCCAVCSLGSFLVILLGAFVFCIWILLHQ